MVVDKQKKDAGGLADKHKITNIPTLIALRDGVELGRIVEFPKETIEQDLACVL